VARPSAPNGSPSSLTTRGGRSRRPLRLRDSNIQVNSSIVSAPAGLESRCFGTTGARTRVRPRPRRGGKQLARRSSGSPRIHPYPFIQQTRKGTKVKQTRLILGPIPPPGPGPGDRLRPCVVGGGWPPCGAGAPPTAWRRSRSRSSASCRRYPSVPSLLLARWVFHGRPEIRKGGAFSGVRFVPGVARLRDVPLICVPRG
jgi:hypothetical protein